MNKIITTCVAIALVAVGSAGVDAYDYMSGRVGRPIPAPVQVTAQASIPVTQDNKLASYSCHPENDPTGRPVLICKNSDSSIVFNCTSAGSFSDGSLDYYC